MRTNESISAKKLAGVETPSQVRYVQQLARHLRQHDAWLESPETPPACEEALVWLQSLELECGLIADAVRRRPLRVLVQCGGPCVSDLVLETPSFDPSTL
eukprot:CAMPEP_0172692020 /NCGR_PEP_ID=MMETSP1074-20121228/24946_1 /TAXON_ID=2916 /ORGANISM="Ceratium fusus, Strain PA161109" /LENGTH=99 /DNA_ID=CAMNT_0013512145 /DNA_START=84 /DNA_END=380 /DNA_ORIENTATION=-